MMNLLVSTYNFLKLVRLEKAIKLVDAKRMMHFIFSLADGPPGFSLVFLVFFFFLIIYR